MNEEEERKWFKDLQSFIYKTISPIIPEADRSDYVGQQEMKIWGEAFTNETYSPIYNYEVLEMLGDAILKMLFPNYLLKLYPELNQEQITNLNVAYMKGYPQAEMSRNMGLQNYVRVLGIDRATLGVEGDLFESFFGALFRVSDMVLQKKRNNPNAEGYGYLNCNNMLIYLFRDVHIDLSKAEGDPKTLVLQMFSRFSRLGISEIKPKEETDGAGNVTITIRLDQSQMDFLRENGIIIKNPVIGKATASTKSGASPLAFKKALDTLKAYGATPEWAEEIKRKLDLETPHLQPYNEDLKKKLQEDGYKAVYFQGTRKMSGKNTQVIQLIGVRDEQPIKTVLSSYLLVGNDIPEAQVELVRIYLKKRN